MLTIKHFDQDSDYGTLDQLLVILEKGSIEQMTGLLIELVADTTSLRSDAPTKYVFAKRLDELVARLRADGYEVVAQSLSRLNPAAEPVAEMQDYLESELGASGLDADGAIRRLLVDAHNDLSAVPSDLNGGTTKVRVALESVARMAARLTTKTRNVIPAPVDSWGAALTFLKQQAIIEQREEDALVKVYSLISDGAHVPKGLSDEQWALLSRTYAVCGIYFLVRQYVVANPN